MGLRHRPEGTLFSLGRVALLFAFLKLSCTLVEAGRRVRGNRTTTTVGTIVRGKRRAGCQRTASLASMMAMTASSRLPLALIKVCSRWRSWWRSPGAVVAERVAGQTHDGVPQLGEAFRQILHVSCSFACAGPGFWQEPARIGPATGHSFEVTGRGAWCEGVEHRVPPWIARQNGGDAGRIGSSAPPGSPQLSRPRPLRLVGFNGWLHREWRTWRGRRWRTRHRSRARGGRSGDCRFEGRHRVRG